MTSTSTASAGTSTTAARFIGQSITRKEDRRLVTGHGQYVDDVVLPAMLHGAFLRSEVARATITGIDTSAARELPGVVAVFTWQDFDGTFGEAWHAMLSEAMVVPPPLAIGDVRYVGDLVAFVVAESRYVAEDACELIEVDYDLQTAVADYRTAKGDTDNVVHAAWGMQSNAMADVPFMPLSGDLEETFAAAAHVVECDIEQNRYLALPMETRGILASWNPGREEMAIVCATQSVHETRNFFARYLQVDEANVTVTARDVGGGFGQKMFAYREECAVVLASRALGRPVKWVEDRRENLIGAGHSRNERARVKLAIDDDLVIQAIAVVDHVADVGAYAICPAAMDPMLVPGPYKIPRYGFTMSMVWTNTMGKAAYRGPWMFETTLREMAIDVAAHELGVDPVELRRRNLLSMGDLPFTSPGNNTFQEITPLETLEQALEMLDLDAFRVEQAAARAEGRHLGLGVSVYVEPTSMGSSTLYTEAATVRVEASGKVIAFLGTTSHGQSIETTMAQIVADQLGVGYDDVTVVQADTQSTPWGPGTGGSRTAVIAGGAVRASALAVREKVLAVAAHAMEASPDDLEIADSTVSVRGTPSRSMSMKDVATLAYRNAGDLPPEVAAGLEATMRFRPTQFPTWSNATHLCVVEIDATSWVPRIVRYIVSEDCGRMINPMVVEGQIFGGVVQGVGGVLLEDFVYDDDGNPLTTTFMDYLPPTTSEVPEIEVGHIETDSTTNPGGYKGMGEGGAIGAHAAAANAVGDALAHLGVRITGTPLGPDQIFALVEESRARA
jgi:aerobic carbon-monoxide dehydrogenase large subunit